ncbi:hypothetical protein DBR22_04785 [Arthrobacter sp. HMWF013]|nr:hypothetical protein DBR22_04785 [Arthrobacter sp. HMWF013]
MAEANAADRTAWTFPFVLRPSGWPVGWLARDWTTSWSSQSITAALLTLSTGVLPRSLPAICAAAMFRYLAMVPGWGFRSRSMCRTTTS